MWAEIGVTANIVSRAQGENIDAVIAGDFQVVLWGGIGGGDPDNDYVDFHSGTGQNFSGFNTPEIDAALDAGPRAHRPRGPQGAVRHRAAGAGRQRAVHLDRHATSSASSPAQGAGRGRLHLPDGSPGQPISGQLFFLKDVWLQQ